VNSKAESQSQAWCRKFFIFQPMPQYEILFHLKTMANGKNLASGKSFKLLEYILFLEM
jgi:hypothetical protein